MFGWWDDLELWLTGLPFLVQFALVMAVLLPVGVGVAMALDRLVGAVVALVRGRRR